MKRGRLWWLLAALPLAWLPLVAQETAEPQKPAETPAPVEAQAPAEAPAPATGEPADKAAAREPPPREEGPIEQVSADNNLSFPVDI